MPKKTKPATAIVTVINGEPTTTSVALADGTKSSHEAVIKLVRKYQNDLEEFGFLGFEIQENRGTQGAKTEFAILNEPQSTLLLTYMRNNDVVRGFKKRLVREFFDMRKELTRRAIQQQDAAWQQVRQQGKVARLELTDAVHEFVEYATSQGSKNASRYYTNITKAEYRALFLIGKAVDKGFRDTLTAIQNANLTTAEAIAQRALREGMAACMEYHAIYAMAKKRIEQFAAMVGKSKPGNDWMALAA